MTFDKMNLFKKISILLLVIDKFLLFQILINPNNQEKLPKRYSWTIMFHTLQQKQFSLDTFVLSIRKKISGYKPLKRQSCHGYQSEAYHNAEP